MSTTPSDPQSNNPNQPEQEGTTSNPPANTGETSPSEPQEVTTNPEGSPTSAPVGEKAPKGRSTWPYTILIVLVLTAGAYGYYVYEQRKIDVPPVNQVKFLHNFYERHKTLRTPDPALGERGEDGVCKAPNDKSKWIDPDTLVFSAVASSRAPTLAKDYKDLMEAIAKATGKKVVYAEEIEIPYGLEQAKGEAEDQLTALKTGNLHITAFNTGLVPGAVNRAGFVPLYCPADKDGKYHYVMKVFVREEDNSINGLADLRGRKVAITTLTSNSGGKAPLVALKELNLMPGRDYELVFSGSHQNSMYELEDKQNDAACVASDLIEREFEEGDKAKPEPAGEDGDESKSTKRALNRHRFRVVYSSRNFPPMCFGVPHNLKPELVEKIKGVFDTFKIQKTSVKGAFNSHLVNFARVDYRKDWAHVVEIDDALTKLDPGGK